MRSFIMIEIEHGEDTDMLDEFIKTMHWETGELRDFHHKPIAIRDLAVRVDVPPFMTGVNINAIIDRGIGIEH